MSMWDNTTGQRAIVFRDGRAYDLTWQTPNRTQPIQFLDETGEAFRLKPGNTWVVVFGLNSSYTVNDANWVFTFFMP
jgi:hypothetical protein